MQIQLILVLLFFLSPVLIIFITGKSKLANRIGAIIIAYGLGLFIGNIGLFPSAGQYLTGYLANNDNVNLSDITELFNRGLISADDVTAFKVSHLQNLILTITIPLALPLLLFSLNIKGWFRMAGKTAASMILSMVSVVLVVGVVTVAYRNRIEDLSKIGGMLVGLYSGGTPNLAALKIMLSVDAETYLKVHTYDMIPSLMYLVFLVSIGKTIFRKFMLPYPYKEDSALYNHISFTENAYEGIFRRKTMLNLLFALFLSVLIFGIAGSTTLIVRGSDQMLIVVLTITTLSIFASLIPAVNNLEKTFELGMYFILVFSIAVASMANYRRLIDISGALISLITIIIFGSLLLHTLLCKLYKVDADTLMITSTALICSPPFVPMVAGALKNKEVVISGLTVGIIGYAAGNYLGILVSFLLNLII
ncbi:MAG: DUF819 family protein [Bacteroidales bacterium]|jgi:uncharacterized membrane protein